LSGTSHAVFISYASQDAEAASRICQALRAAGIEVWFDQSELRGGDAWDRSIRQQIRECQLFVPVISAHSDARKEGYFRREWKLAVDRTHDMSERVAFLVPVVLDDTSDAGADVPDRFREVQWTRLLGGETPAAFVERVRRLLSADASAARAAATPVPPGSKTVQRFETSIRPARSKPVWLATGAVLAVALAYLAVDKFWISKRSMTPQPAAAQVSKSLAVLPFINVRGNKEQDYLGAGIAAEVGALLGKLPGVRVVGLRSSSQFQARTDDLRTIGEKLGVSYVIDGSIQRSAEQIHVTAQLIETRDGVQRWSDVYDRRLNDVIRIQDEIASNVARILQVGAGDELGSHMAVRNAAAYDLYLRGLHGLDSETRANCEEAVAHFQGALQIDPEFAEASAALAMAYWIMGDQVWLPPREAFENARQAAQNAIKLKPKLGSAHAALSEIHLLYDWDWAAAEREANLAISLGAGAEGLKARARVAATFAQWALATQLLQSALATDPLDPMLHMNLGYVVALRSGRFAEAAAETKRTLELSPDYGSALYYHGVALLLQNHLDDALATMQQAKVDDAQPEGLAIVFFAMGRKAESDAAVERAIAADGDDWPYGIATIMAFRHETDKAMYWLERAYAQRDPSMYTIKGEPLFRSIENDSRYKAMLRKLNLPE
jgi:TolB-like protein/Tfp pilus assembly protein PilF